MSTIRIQALPKFPASVEAGDGITIERSAGVFTFSLDPEGGEFARLNADNEFVGTNTFSGNVGIGTSAPARLLQVGDGTGSKIARIAGGGAAAQGAALEFISATDVWALGNNRAVLGEASNKDFIFYTSVTGSAFRFYNNGSESVRVDPAGLSIGGSGAAQAPLSLTTNTYDFFLAKPSATAGALVQMQYGKMPGNPVLPGSGGISAIELNMNFDGGSTGSNSRYSTALTLVNNMQAGTAGASLGAFVAARATGTWSPNVSGLGGATAGIYFAESSRGGAVL